jgi:hypothetical protein
MRKIRFLAASALVVLAGAAQAAAGPDAGAKAARKHTLARAAQNQLRRDDVPSARTEPVDAKTRADADLAARDARAKGPRLQVQRQNLKGADAARAIRQQTTPNSIDRATAYGDKDHTEQVTNLKVTVKK